MDNTELHYVTYDPDAIWDEMIANYVEAGGDILYPGDEKEMLLRSVQADITQVLAGVDNALRMMTLRYAVGEYLDVYADGKVERIQASSARTTVTLTTIATGEPATIAAGTAITADGVVFYDFADDIVLTGSEQTLSAEIVCEREGTSGNALSAGTEMSFQKPGTEGASAISSIVVVADASGGNNREEDESYRERIYEHGLMPVTTGTEDLYESAAKAVSSQILDAHAVRLSAGVVGVYLLLEDGAGSTAIIQDVTTALSGKTTRPLTDTVSVSLAEDIEYVLNIQYASDSSSSVSSAIAQAVSDYEKWQDETIGRAFNPDRLMAAIYQAGATRVVWGTGSKFGDDGPVEYTEIDEHQRCKGTITLTEL